MSEISKNDLKFIEEAAKALAEKVCIDPNDCIVHVTYNNKLEAERMPASDFYVTSKIENQDSFDSELEQSGG